jgi:hypothetical protein
MTKQRWRDVWDETRAAMKQLEESMAVVRELERAGMVAEHATTCSDGIQKTLALMQESVNQVRRRMHAADVQLTTAIEALMFDSMFDEKEEVYRVV